MSWYKKYRKITLTEDYFMKIENGKEVGELIPKYMKCIESGRWKWKINTYYYIKINDKFKRIYNYNRCPYNGYKIIYRKEAQISYPEEFI